MTKGVRLREEENTLREFGRTYTQTRKPWSIEQNPALRIARDTVLASGEASTGFLLNTARLAAKNHLSNHPWITRNARAIDFKLKTFGAVGTTAGAYLYSMGHKAIETGGAIVNNVAGLVKNSGVADLTYGAGHLTGLKPDRAGGVAYQEAETAFLEKYEEMERLGHAIPPDVQRQLTYKNWQVPLMGATAAIAATAIYGHAKYGYNGDVPKLDPQEYARMGVEPPQLGAPLTTRLRLSARTFIGQDRAKHDVRPPDSLEESQERTMLQNREELQQSVREVEAHTQAAMARVAELRGRPPVHVREPLDASLAGHRKSVKPESTDAALAGYRDMLRKEREPPPVHVPRDLDIGAFPKETTDKAGTHHGPPMPAEHTSRWFFDPRETKNWLWDPQHDGEE